MWGFSEAALLQKSSTLSVEGHIQSAIFLWIATDAHYSAYVSCVVPRVLLFSALITLLEEERRKKRNRKRKRKRKKKMK